MRYWFVGGVVSSALIIVSCDGNEPQQPPPARHADDDADGDADSENRPPTATLAADPSDGVAPLAVAFTAATSDPDGDALSLTWSFGDGESAAGTSSTASHTYSAPGSYTATVEVSDGRGGTGTASATITVSTLQNQPPLASFTVTPAAGEAGEVLTFDAQESSDADGVLTSFAWDFGDGSVGADSVATHTFAIAGVYDVQLTVTDDAGSVGVATRAVTISTPNILPPDPADVAPALSPSADTTMADATRFLYEGDDPIQTGVAPGTIDAERVAVLRGVVRSATGDPLPGAVVSVFGRAELGVTMSRADGAYDLAVNGGEPLVLALEMVGYMPAQRRVSPPVQEYEWLEDVVLLAYDTAVTEVIPWPPPRWSWRAARRRPTAAARGRRPCSFPRACSPISPCPTARPSRSRRSTSAPPNTRWARMGPRRCRPISPYLSGYTYAVELSVDEAVDAGATSVMFSVPVPFYVENFLHFPVGTPVPSGFYNCSASKWLASESGVVIQVLDTSAGVAELDSRR